MRSGPADRHPPAEHDTNGLAYRAKVNTALGSMHDAEFQLKGESPAAGAGLRKRREKPVEQGQLNWIANFIWGIADDVLRDLYVRGKYRDVILPMTVLRRLDALLEPSKQAVLDLKEQLDAAGVTNQDAALRQASGQAFYNTSRFTLRSLRARSAQQQLRADFEAWLDGFSPNVQDILDRFEFRHQVPRLSSGDALGSVIEKLPSPEVNLSPEPVRMHDGSVRLPGLDNHAMGTIFEELVRRFNEENNEEAGEHWTPRDAVKLMANLVFLPVADELESGTYLLYDGACGTGGMLTVAEDTLRELAEARGKQVATHLYGQEINAETYAICKADLLLKGEGEAADNIIGGGEHSTLSNDAFPAPAFDFMLSNPPYGKSWKTDLERLGGKAGIRDRRFVVEHDGDPEFSLLTRSSDGQMLFLNHSPAGRVNPAGGVKMTAGILVLVVVFYTAAAFGQTATSPATSTPPYDVSTGEGYRERLTEEQRIAAMRELQLEIAREVIRQPLGTPSIVTTPEGWKTIADRLAKAAGGVWQDGLTECDIKQVASDWLNETDICSEEVIGARPMLEIKDAWCDETPEEMVFRHLDFPSDE